MKLKIFTILLAIFFTGMVLLGTCEFALAKGPKDQPDSVVDDLQSPFKTSGKKPTGPKDKYEKERTPEGDIKKPPAPGKDGKPVKYSDQGKDYYWGTDGHLYPWPPPKEKAEYGATEGEGGWSGHWKGVKFGGARIKTREEIEKETEERMKKLRKKQKRKAREAKKQKKREKELKIKGRPEEDD